MRIASNALADVRRFYLAELKGLYPAEEAGALFDWAAEEILGEPRAVFRAQADRRVSESELLRFFEAAKRLRKGEPVQYVFGRAYFDDMVLEVSPAVLIPRPETEQLVSLVAEEAKAVQTRLTAGGGRLRVWDACTGSGCIALALYRRLNGQAEVLGSDVSDEALVVARRNAGAWGMPAAAPLRFIRHDLLADAPLAGPWHVIVSNPPYVRESEKALMRGNVLHYEPASALFVPDADPLRFYETLGRIARNTLAEDGVLWAEINEALPDELTALYRGLGFSAVEIRRDFRDKPRFVRVRR
ncbi:MAG: peptide chain release factor N(5)-glutamine methyltransferase [Bacteroidales bacterium]|nr:peptide chain release factor N(5)-glutamine methyltransferase [Bacteroidales bacterium]